MEVYDQRRDQWTEEFKSHLVDDVFKYADQSTLITIRLPQTEFDSSHLMPFRREKDLDQIRTKAGIIGTLRTIDAKAQRHEQLPMEEALGVTVPSNGGIKVEIGSFTINREHNKAVFAELWISMIREAQKYLQRPDHEPNKPLFYTYADPASMRMYATPAMGFAPVSGLEPVEYEGRKWTIIGTSAEDLVALPSRLSQTRSQWKPDEASAFERIVNAFDTLPIPQPIAFDAHHDSVQAPLPVHSFAAIQTSKVTEGVQTIALGTTGNALLFDRVFIPDAHLPLKDGDHFVFEHMGLKQSVSYKNGVLKVQALSRDPRLWDQTRNISWSDAFYRPASKDSAFEFTFTAKTDSYLLSITDVLSEYKEALTGKVVHRSAISF
jgi:hypothetical protein